MDESVLKILQVNTSDNRGGAERVSWNLFTAYRKLGHQSQLAVGHKSSLDKDVLELSYRPKPFSFAGICARCGRGLDPFVGRVRGASRVRHLFGDLERGWCTPVDKILGREDFNFPASRNLLQITRELPDIVHGHNLHHNYFDLRTLPQLSQTVPVVLTLHDAWLLSGHCAHSFDCERWRTGCGTCPDLTIFPSIRRDSTAFNWRRKRDIFARSKLYIATPSQWLLQKARASMLAPAIQDARVIVNGVDLSIFRPAADREKLRRRLGIDAASRVVCFAANGIRQNVFKDYLTFRAAITRLAAEWSGPPLIFLALGEEGLSESIGQARLDFVPYHQDIGAMARYLQCTDVYVHSARVDTFPNTVIEALACGTPVVATAVGGISEQIESSTTGFLVAPGDASDMATRIRLLLREVDLRQQMSLAAENIARRRFDLANQAAAYVAWYRSILEANKQNSVHLGLRSERELGEFKVTTPVDHSASHFQRLGEQKP